MTRQEYLEGCKQRALELVKIGDINGAYASMISDLKKHPETENHSAIQLGMMLLLSGNLNSQKAMKDFIDGFN